MPVSLPLTLLAAFAAFAIALAFAPAAALAFAPAAARAADDEKDWTILGETSIKDAKDAAKDSADRGGSAKDRKRGEKDGQKEDKKREGEKKAEPGTAAGEIDVRAALVKRIKFEVRGAEVEFKKIIVTYESGDPEEIEVREEKVRNRGRTRTIDLKGGNRAIKKVLVSYKAEKTDNAKDSDRDSKIILLGHK